MSLQDRGFPDSFVHPSAGASELDTTLIAVRWRDDASEEGKQQLVGAAGLGLVTLDDDRRPVVSVNRTDLLWWLRSADGAGIDESVVDTVQGSELVAWVSPAYRSRPAGDAPELGVFAVNPTRLYVRRAVMQVVAAEPELTGTGRQAERAGRIPGYVLIQVEAGSAITYADTVRRLADDRRVAGPGAVRLETVPFLSPACCGPGSDCRPPAGPFTPDDPDFGQQWGLPRIQVPNAWQIRRGSPDVVIAVLDEGVELGHPDLDLYPQSWNASTDTPDGGPVGDHGTACAGIAAARLDNALGVAGVAGGSRVMAIATATWADTDIAEGLYFAADNGARVVSMSFGVYPEWGMWDFDLIRDALQYAHDRGLLLVAASGNEDGAVARFPGSDARTLCVGGVNRSEERKRIGDSSSEDFWGASYGPDLDVVAPCLEIPTTDRLGGAGYDAGDYFGRFNGTSAATPHVAGLGALLFSLRPDLDNAEARSLIESSCDKISPALYSYANVATKPSGTWNEEVGYGRVNAERALLAACAARPGHGGCDGCGGNCEQDTPAGCRGPKPVRWLEYDRCQFHYESRIFGAGRTEQGRLEIRVSYEHCLRLVGQQQGPLLYTTTLLPGEKLELYEFDRYRRVRSEEQRMSVHSSFRQTLSALSQTRRFASQSAYADMLAAVRTQSDTSFSVGGGLAGFFGAPSGREDLSVLAETSVASGSSVQVAGESFTQNAIAAAQSTESERSLVVSSFEDAEHRETTRRLLRNRNECHAVTYFVRRVLEVYEATTRVTGIEWRTGDQPWRSIDDLTDEAAQQLKPVREILPRIGEQYRDARQVTIPTDGTLYEAELAYCSSCEPTRAAAERIDVERARLAAVRECKEIERL